MLPAVKIKCTSQLSICHMKVEGNISDDYRRHNAPCILMIMLLCRAAFKTTKRSPSTAIKIEPFKYMYMYLMCLNQRQTDVMVQPKLQHYVQNAPHTPHEEDNLILNRILCLFIRLMDWGASDRLHFAQLVIQFCHQPAHAEVSLIPAGEATMFSGLSLPHRAASVEDKKHKRTDKNGEPECDIMNHNYTSEWGGCVCSLSLCQMSWSSVG